MSTPSLDELIQGALDDTLAPEQVAVLNERLRQDPAARSRYLQAADLHAVMAVDEQVWIERQPALTVAPRASWWRTLRSAAAGLLVGLCGGSMAWAMASPDLVATVTRLLWLVDGGFEAPAGAIPNGFPTAPGYWSGDQAEIVAASDPGDDMTAAEGKQVLRLIAARPDGNVTTGQASSCDVFQVVDLRQLRAQASSGDVSLEVSAKILDARAAAGELLWFTCRLYLFPGHVDPLHASWPEVLKEAQGVAIASRTSRGGSASSAWVPLAARCLVPEQADLAVVMVSCGYQPGDRRALPALGHQYVDGVTLSLHQQPVLPTRTMTGVVP